MNKIINILCKIFWIFPIKQNKIFMLCFDGTHIGYDSRVFAEWLNEHDTKFEIVWGCKTKELAKSLSLNNVKFIKLKSIKGIYNILTSKVIFFNITLPRYLPYRKNQIKICTWHGYAYKKVGKYLNNYSKELYNLADCYTSHSKLYTNKVLADSFEFSKTVLNCGVPRNDIFFNKAKIKERNNSVRRYFNLKENSKIILYAPTFRNDFKQAEVELDYKSIIKAAKKRFGWKDCIFLYRFHPMIKNVKTISDDQIIDATKYPDMQDLLCAAEILITDYSGSIWDFSVSRKPVFLYATDINKYKNERGLYYNMEKLPFKIATSNNQLINNIRLFNKEKYRKNLDEYQISNMSYEKGNSCETIYKYIQEQIKK